MVSGFADFLKDTLTDNVKGLLKPANWLVSAIFVVLNLIFVIPVLIDENILSPTNIFIANPSLQLVASVVLILLIAYALSSAKINIFLFIAGNLQLLLSQLSKQEQVSRTREDIDEKAREAIQLPKNDALLQALITDPNKNKQKPSSSNPTNVNVQSQASTEPVTSFTRKKHILLNDTEYGIRQKIYEQWGINWEFLDHHFEDAISDKVEWKRVNNEQEALDFFISLTFILILFATEDILVQFFWPEGLNIVWGWIFLGTAYITYRLAVSKMRAWGQALEHAITVHRETVRQEFGLRSFKDTRDEREIWQAISKWAYSKNSEDIPDSILPRQFTSTPSNKNVKIDVHAEVITPPNPVWETIINGPIKFRQQVHQEIKYVVLISNNGADSNNSDISDIFISAFDPEVPMKRIRHLC